jgi:hypothetical protein
MVCARGAAGHEVFREGGHLQLRRHPLGDYHWYCCDASAAILPVIKAPPQSHTASLAPCPLAVQITICFCCLRRRVSPPRPHARPQVCVRPMPYLTGSAGTCTCRPMTSMLRTVERASGSQGARGVFGGRGGPGVAVHGAQPLPPPLRRAGEVLLLCDATAHSICWLVLQLYVCFQLHR